MVLYVEDDEQVLKYYIALLENMNIKVEGYTESPRALEAFETNPDKYTHAILDVHMPKLCGEYLAKEFRKEKPDMPILFMTGLTDSNNVENLSKLGDYIKKETLAPKMIQKFAAFIWSQPNPAP